GDNVPVVEVIDSSGIFAEGLKDKKAVKLHISSESLEDAKKKVIADKDAFVLYIPADISSGGSLELFSQKKPGLSVLSGIEDQLNELMRNKLLEDAGIDAGTLDNINPSLSIVSKELTLEGEKDSSSG